MNLLTFCEECCGVHAHAGEIPVKQKVESVPAPRMNKKREYAQDFADLLQCLDRAGLHLRRLISMTEMRRTRPISGQTTADVLLL